MSPANWTPYRMNETEAVNLESVQRLWNLRKLVRFALEHDCIAEARILADSIEIVDQQGYKANCSTLRQVRDFLGY